jgi:hypothetical protein
MNFFCTKNHYDEWVNNMNLSEDDIFCLSAREALDVAYMIFNVE